MNKFTQNITLRVKWSRIVEEFTIAYDNMYLNATKISTINLDLTGITIEKPNAAWRPLVILDTLLLLLAIDKMYAVNAIGRKFDQYEVLKQSIILVISESFVDFQLKTKKPYEQYQLSPIITIIDYPNEWSNNISLNNYILNYEILLIKSTNFLNAIKLCFNNYYMKTYGIHAIVIKICNTIYFEVCFLIKISMNCLFDCYF